MDRGKNRIFVVSQPEIIGHTGGAVSVFRHFCNMLDDAGYGVCTMCWSDSRELPSGLNSGVRFVNLRYADGDGVGFSQSLQRLIDGERPDLLVFFFHFVYILADLPKKYDSIPRILMFHSRPDFYFAIDRHSRFRLKRRYRNTVSQVLLDSFRDFLPRFIRKGPVSVIPNYVPKPDVSRNLSVTRNRIVYLSRIDSRKGVDLLIDAFALLHPGYPDWSVDVWGEADSEEYLESLKARAGEKGLGECFNFRGVTPDPPGTLSEYDFCAFPSRFEGFSMGLTESMSVGLPCVGLKSCSGVNELILDGVNGILCDPDPQSYARGLEKLMSKAELRSRLGRNARLYMEQFSEAAYEQKWLALIHGILEKGEAACGCSSEDVQNLIRL